MLLLVLSLAAPGLAAVDYGLPYNLTLDGAGNITGTIGGVPVTGTYSGGTFTLTAGGLPFASGTYTCSSSACNFTITSLAGKPVAIAFTTGVSNSAPTAGTTSGSATGAFANHGAWVSSVARWANQNLTGNQIGQMVSAAARSQGETKRSEHQNSGNGNGHGH